MATRWRQLAVATTVWAFLAAAPSAGSESTERATQMQFFCNTGYSIESCRTQVAALRRVLSTVDVAALGEWTWVLVRSEDWKPILRRVGRDPDSPAFTILDKRQTFLEEALFVRMAGRSASLLEKFHIRLDLLLEHAVLHELGHAICGERDEVRIYEYASQLRDGGLVTCANASSLEALRRSADVDRCDGGPCRPREGVPATPQVAGEDTDDEVVEPATRAKQEPTVDGPQSDLDNRAGRDEPQRSSHVSSDGKRLQVLAPKSLALRLGTPFAAPGAAHANRSAQRSGRRTILFSAPVAQICETTHY